MNIQIKQEKLKQIYDDFEIRVRPFKSGAVCEAGCAFCCTHFGNVDTITLEGLIIHEWIEALDKQDQIDIRKKIAKNMKKREKGSITRCPFLKKDNTCRIYTIRPFSCRQLYSLRKCTDSGPMVHRQAVELAKQTVKKLQQLDETGYSERCIHQEDSIRLTSWSSEKNTALSLTVWYQKQLIRIIWIRPLPACPNHKFVSMHNQQYKMTHNRNDNTGQ